MKKCHSVYAGMKFNLLGFPEEGFQLKSAEVNELEETHKVKITEIFDYSATLMKRKRLGIGYAHTAESVRPLDDAMDAFVFFQ